MIALCKTAQDENALSSVAENPGNSMIWISDFGSDPILCGFAVMIFVIRGTTFVNLVERFAILAKLVEGTSSARRGALAQSVRANDS